MIELQSRDLQIKKITTKDGDEVELVEIKGGVAFDSDFIEEMRLKGVKDKAIKQEEETEE